MAEDRVPGWHGWLGAGECRRYGRCAGRGAPPRQTACDADADADCDTRTKRHAHADVYPDTDPYTGPDSPACHAPACHADAAACDADAAACDADAGRRDPARLGFHPRLLHL